MGRKMGLARFSCYFNRRVYRSDTSNNINTYFKMTYNELRELCRRGKVGRIPKWVGYVKYNYGSEEL